MNKKILKDDAIISSKKIIQISTEIKIHKLKN